MKPVTIAVIADTHYGANSSASALRCEIADILLMRTVYRLNRLIRPDITLVLGDVLDNGKSCDSVMMAISLISSSAQRERMCKQMPVGESIR